MAQRPKLAPYIPMMTKKISEVLETDENTINIKATTTEKLGFIGREEGMAAQVVVLLLEH